MRPLTQNLYAYCSNNAVMNMLDTSLELGLTDSFKIGGGIDFSAPTEVVGEKGFFNSNPDFNAWGGMAVGNTTYGASTNKNSEDLKIGIGIGGYAGAGGELGVSFNIDKFIKEWKKEFGQ